MTLNGTWTPVHCLTLQVTHVFSINSLLIVILNIYLSGMEIVFQLWARVNCKHTMLTTPATLNLNNVLYTPDIIKNLVSVRQFTIDNNVSLEFDPHGFSVKDLRNGKILTRHNSTGVLYPFTTPTSLHLNFLSTSSTDLWHFRLGHPTVNIIDYLRSESVISCNKSPSSTHSLCLSYQVSKHKCLPFYESTSSTSLPFDIIHCDLWTSPIPNKSGYKYYMVLIDNFTHYVWVYPLKLKLETFSPFTQFHSFV